jgi:hypothetical protein
MQRFGVAVDPGPVGFARHNTSVLEQIRSGSELSPDLYQEYEGEEVWEFAPVAV